MKLYLEILGFYLELGRAEDLETEEEPEAPEPGPRVLLDSQQPMITGAYEDFDVRTPIGFRTGYWGDEDKKR